MSEDEIELCEIHGCPLEDFVSATEEGTEYFTYCPKCDAEYEKYLLEHPNDEDYIYYDSSKQSIIVESDDNDNNN